MNNDQHLYYKKRAAEYEAVYEKPERQEDLKKLKAFIPQLFNAKTVLEIGCGTGYWTEIIASSCTSILATDINEAMLAIARNKTYRILPSFRLADYGNLPKTHPVDLIFGGFIISHVKREVLKQFVENFQSKLGRGGAIVFLDNLYVEGSSTPISHEDEQGNTYQTRRLQNGDTFEVLKNFYSQSDWKELIGSIAKIEWVEYAYFQLTILRSPHKV